MQQQQQTRSRPMRAHGRYARLGASMIVAAVAVAGAVAGSSAKAAVKKGPVLPLSGHRISVGDMTVVEGEAATFTVHVVPAPARLGVSSISVRVATLDGSTSGGDYSPVTTQLTFGPGESAGQLTVQTAEDALLEQNETFFLLLSDATHTCSAVQRRCDGVSIIDDRGVGTINDDDAAVPAPPAPPSASISDVTNATKASDCTLIVALDRTSTSPAALRYDATGALDRLAGPTSGTLTFAPGMTTQSIVLDVAKLKRRVGVVTVTLSDPSGAVVGDSFGTCGIRAKRR